METGDEDLLNGILLWTTEANELFYVAGKGDRHWISWRFGLKLKSAV